MIDRYSRPPMSHLWSEQAKCRTWLDIEILACEGWAELGKIPKTALQEIKTKARFDEKVIEASEAITRHDVAAFVSEVQRNIGEAGRFVHMGLTSSDVLDTTFSYRLVKSAEILMAEIDALLALTKSRALRDKEVSMIGRTHGIHAEPVTMGMKWLYWHDLFKRCRVRLVQAKEEVGVGKLSGAVGNYAQIPPQVESYVCGKLRLKPDSFSTQVISRDRYAAYFSALALLGSVVETIAVEMRHLQRTEVSEVREGFSEGQKGSSAMPHKRNPITAENLTGIARLLRGWVIPALENCALWHERDISHSSVERVLGPDANILSHYMLVRLRECFEGLEIFPEQMKANLERLKGVIHSQSVLLRLVDAGVSRDDAYEIVQKTAWKALDSGLSFAECLGADPRVAKRLSAKDLSMILDNQNSFRHLDYLYKKVLG